MDKCVVLNGDIPLPSGCSLHKVHALKPIVDSIVYQTENERPNADNGDDDPDYVYVDIDNDNDKLIADNLSNNFDLTMDDLVLNKSYDSIASTTSSTLANKHALDANSDDDSLREVIVYVQKNSRLKLVVLSACDTDHLKMFNFDSTIKLVSLCFISILCGR